MIPKDQKTLLNDVVRSEMFADTKSLDISYSKFNKAEKKGSPQKAKPIINKTWLG